MAPQSVVVFGATGSLGSLVAKELVNAGHTVTGVVRDAKASDTAKAAQLKQLRDGGVALHEADLGALSVEEAAELLKQHTIVVSVLGGQDLEALQLKLVEAAKAADTITRFLPSEFGLEKERVEGEFPDLVKPMFNGKMAVRQALADSGVPYTLVVTHAFLPYLIPGLGAMGAKKPGDSVDIYGDGDTPVHATSLQDIAAVTAKAVDDPKAENKLLEIRGDTVTQNQLVAAWERLTDSTVKRREVSGADLDARISLGLKTGNFMQALFASFEKLIWVGGTIKGKESSNTVQARDLYGDLKFESAEDYLKGMASARS